MRVQTTIGIASLLQLYGAVYALPTEQQRLRVNDSPDVQAVQAAYVPNVALKLPY